MDYCLFAYSSLPQEGDNGECIGNGRNKKDFTQRFQECNKLLTQQGIDFREYYTSRPFDDDEEEDKSDDDVRIETIKAKLNSMEMESSNEAEEAEENGDQVFERSSNYTTLGEEDNDKLKMYEMMD